VVELLDDPQGVPDNVVLYRRTTWDKIGGRPQSDGTESYKVSPNFFTDAPPSEAARYGLARVCMSVGVSTVVGDHPEQMLEAYPTMGLVSIRAGALRSLRKGDGTPCPQGIMLYPTEEEPWHAVVFDLTEDKRSGGAAKAIARLAAVVVPLRT
jgi:hypothetical protein